ncbi:hypothetical protein OH799_14295 [Nocardia sp. NBC_00881]|uniref:hypothetical protein n=1 Tax=Nocardia sp. NBC_00881 TaxID=2975995 RepID=UPI00386AC681|nr:hypothetical protein OH799_14295 [Nocardia sp. NBC_00881]
MSALLDGLSAAPVQANVIEPEFLDSSVFDYTRSSALAARNNILQTTAVVLAIAALVATVVIAFAS